MKSCDFHETIIVYKYWLLFVSLKEESDEDEEEDENENEDADEDEDTEEDD